MTSQVSTKVRLVRCPKCREVLAELPEVPLYQCGGCGTVLQAKSRRPETSSTEPSSHETDSIAKTQKDVSETSSSDKDFATRLEAESLSDKDNITVQDKNGDSAELSDGKSVLSSSPKAAYPQIEDSSIETNDFLKCDSSGEISKRYLLDDNEETGRGTNFSDELPSSGELALEAELYNTEQHNNDQMWQKGDDFVSIVHNSPEHEYLESVLSPEGETDNRVSPENDDDKSVSRENENTEKNTIASVCDSKVASRSPSKESLVSFYVMSSDNEQNPDHSPNDGNLGRLTSLDMLGSSFPLMTNNYPNTQSYYAYDGSESSYDGNDDRIAKRISQSGPRKIDVGPTEMLRTNNMFRANSEPEWAPTRSSNHADRNHHWGRGKSTEINRYTTGNRTRLAGPGPESYRHSSLPPRPVFKPSYPEPDNIDLLRTVCELKDQINRMHFQYDRYPPDMEIYSGACRRTGYNPRHNNNNNNQKRLAFSGESLRYGPHISCSCLHCRPQDWHHSVQLPPHTAHRKNTPYGPRSDSAPQQYASSEASWCYETDSDNQRHDDEIIKRARLKEKYFKGKRHARPVAGGAPMVVCYHCSELLHLPVDFLLFKKKYHRLMCDACKKVLRFSVQNGTHIVPYVPEASAPPPPPSEVSRRNTESVSRAGSIGRADRPVSCSDHYYNGIMSSGSSFETVEDRKMKSVLIEHRDKDEYAGLIRADESAGPSSKWRKGNSEIEEASSSPLHRLMGYSSPSQVLDV
ncbi:hypothetical protein CASFOL_034228 [Castilleja foliolosa]|uniref:Zinc-ribbon domain-containing protein n=1 Tax=Castilleja foliolosa TaxID=1961234 RepID=A0ABD3BXK8_9LAMI